MGRCRLGKSHQKLVAAATDLEQHRPLAPQRAPPAPPGRTRQLLGLRSAAAPPPARDGTPWRGCWRYEMALDTRESGLLVWRCCCGVGRNPEHGVAEYWWPVTCSQSELRRLRKCGGVCRVRWNRRSFIGHVREQESPVDAPAPTACAGSRRLARHRARAAAACQAGRRPPQQQQLASLAHWRLLPSGGGAAKLLPSSVAEPSTAQSARPHDAPSLTAAFQRPPLGALA